jgi:uncharacterized protein YdaU (DUF1376 family)
MNYYPFHLGDYATHTAHLDMLEDLAYRRLLDLYYLREAPIPADSQEAARLIRMKAQSEYVESVLREFFELTEDGWRHSRCDDELARMQDKQAKARASAEASVRARQAKAQHAVSDRSADAQPSLDVGEAGVQLPTPTPTPTPTPSTTSLRSVGDAKVVTVKRPDDVPPEIWRDFQAVRKARRSPLTPKAFEGIEREAKKAGITITEALTICIERGWQGFQASWDWKRTATRGPAPENFGAKDYGKGGDL